MLAQGGEPRRGSTGVALVGFFSVGIVYVAHQLSQRGNFFERSPQRKQIARHHSAESYLAGEALQIEDGFELVAKLFALHGARFQLRDRTEARFNFGKSDFGTQHPGAEQAGTHSGGGLVDCFQQGG